MLANPSLLAVVQDFARRVSQTFQPGQVLTSWWRDPNLNADVGGSPESQHLFGLAVDVTGPQQGFTQQLARQMGLTAVTEIDHLHLQYFPAGVLARAGVEFPRADVLRTDPIGRV